MRSNQLNLRSYDLIAVDMDHTLVKYKLKNLLPLIHRLTNQFLIEKYDFPQEIDEHFCPKLCQKGLIIDKRRGNVLKLGSNYKIISAKHGNQNLSIEQIDRIYGNLYEELTQIPIYLSEGTISKKSDFYVLKDYFTSPSGQIMAKCVEVFDKNGFNGDYNHIWTCIYQILGFMYDRSAFKSRTGGFFEQLQSNPDHYLEKNSDKLKRMFERLRQSGKLVILITSSNIDSARFLMNYCFDREWVSYFDCVMTFARKPTFFTSDRNFLLMDTNDNIQSSVSHEELECGQIYSEGNWNHLISFVAKQTAKEQPKCVYIGDSFTDDCIVPNKYVNCETIAIVEELEEFVRDELEPTHWQSFCVDDSNNMTLWYEFLKTHSQLIIPNLDSLLTYYY